MVKNMRFLICGLGSIGKRHMENLEALGVPCENISIFRTLKGTSSFGDRVLKDHGEKHPVFRYDLWQALVSQKPTAAIISNPTSLHIPAAIECAKAGCHIFLEKPVSHSASGVDELMEIAREKRLIVFVAYQLRFHPLLKSIKNWIQPSVANKIGKVVSVHAEMAERVTDWHPWEDYKISYATRHNLGGGVVGTQSHELDMLYWLFGKPMWVFASGGKLGNLGIEVEDTVKSIFRFPKNVIASLHVDYLKRPPRRFLEITGTEGRIYWDYFEKRLVVHSLGEKIISIGEPELFEHNTVYLREMKHFLECIRTKRQPMIDLQQGRDVLEMILATKESMEKQRIVKI